MAESGAEQSVPETTNPNLNSGRASGEFRVAAGEFARVLTILMGRGNAAGKPPFPKVALAVDAAEDGTSIEASYAGLDGTIGMNAVWNIPGDEDNAFAFDFATDTPGKLLDYVGSFPSDAPLRVHYDGDAGKIRLSDGARTLSLGASPPSQVRRLKAGSFTEAWDGLSVNSSPETRPTSDVATQGSAPWVDRGYTVAEVPTESLLKVLDDGGLLQSNGLEGVVIELALTPGQGIEAVVSDPENADADTIRVQALVGATVLGSRPDKFIVHYPTVESFLRTVRLVKASKITLVHFAGTEAVPKPDRRVTMLIRETDERRGDVLRLSIVFQTWRDPRDAAPSLRRPVPSSAPASAAKPSAKKPKAKATAPPVPIEETPSVIVPETSGNADDDV